MNRAEHLALKQTLWAKIKRLGDLWDEDALETEEYGKSVYEANLAVLGDAVECFSKLVEQAELIRRKGRI